MADRFRLRTTAAIGIGTAVDARWHLSTFSTFAVTSAADWRTRIGDVWAAEWRRTDRSLAALAPALDGAILAAAPPGRFRALDIGCGAGATSFALAASRPDAAIVGTDLSPALIAIAHGRAETGPSSRPLAGGVGGGEPPVLFVVGDAVGIAPRYSPVDLYFSRHGVMFFADPVAAFAALARAGRPGTRLVFSCFAERAANLWAVETLAAFGRDATVPTDDTPGPFAFADPRRVAAILSAAGWIASPPTRATFAYRAGAGDDPVADAVSFFTRIGPAAPLLRDVSPAERPGLLDRLATLCQRRRVGDVVEFPATAWIWSAKLPRENAS